MIAKKFVLPILLCAAIIGTGSPMKRKLEEDKPPCQYNEIVLVDGQIVPDNNEITFDDSSLLGWLYCQPEIITLIASQLDGASFSALTAVSKDFFEICNAIPIKYLISIKFADAPCYGNEQLTRRFLSINAKQIDIQSTLSMSCPSVIENMYTKICESGEIQLTKLLVGSQTVYKIGYKINGSDRVYEYFSIIDMGNHHFVILALKSGQSVKSSSIFAEHGVGSPELIALETIYKMIGKDFVEKNIDCWFFMATAMLNSNSRARDFFIENPSIPIYSQLIDFSFDPTRQEIRTFQENGWCDGAKEGLTASMHVILNMDLIFITAAIQKNHTAIVQLLIETNYFTPQGLMLAAQLTTDDDIKKMIDEALKKMLS